MFTHLINRHNVCGGESLIYSLEGKLLAQFNLVSVLDTLVLWDLYVLHEVSKIKPVKRDAPAIRDLLLVGFDPA